MRFGDHPSPPTIVSPPPADQFETHPDEINWGHVGALAHYRAKLREITDSAFREGEYAE